MNELRKIIGCVDYINSRSIRGWCWDFSEKESVIDFFYKGNLIGTCVANEFRSDLQNQNIRQGFAAFRFEIPEGYSGLEIEIRSGDLLLPKPNIDTADAHFVWRKKRVSLILGEINVTHGRGIEFGPLHDPIIDSSHKGVIYIDHADTSQLQEKYRNDPNVDTREIVNIDFVYLGKDLSQTINETHSLDYAVSSHVGEHIPDFIGWLRDIHSVLNAEGKLVIVLPDKRYCWDIHRKRSTGKEMMAANKKSLKRPNLKMIWNGKFKAVSRDGKITWYTFDNLSKQPQYSKVRSMKEIFASLLKYFLKGEYLDVHCWVFSADTFPILIDELRARDLCDFTLENVFGPEGNEFIAVLNPD